MAPADERANVLYAETRQELARADDKANLLLAVNGLLVSAVLVALLAGHFEPSRLDNRVEWLFWLGSACSLLAEGLLCAAVFPQIKHADRRSPPRYFGDVAGLTATQLRVAMESQEDPYERVLDQLAALAPVAVSKYRLIAAGQVALAAAAALTALSALLNAAIS